MSRRLAPYLLAGSVFLLQNAALAASPASPVAESEELSQASHSVPASLTDAPTTGDSHTAPVRRRWYGWETFTMDGAALGLGALAVGSYGGKGTGGALFGSAALSYYALGAPAVHLLRDQPGKAVASLGLRVGLPVLAMGFVALGNGDCPAQNELDDAERCQPYAKRMLLTGIVSVALASLIDGAVLAWEPAAVPKRLAFSPVLGWDGARGGTAGVAGVF